MTDGPKSTGISISRSSSEKFFHMKWSKPVKARRPPGFIEPCIPTAALKVPEGSLWVHEIKHDGYRLIVRRSEDRVRLFTRHGYDWSDRYPRILEAAKKTKGTFLIDGEAVVSDESGIADFEQLHSREHDKSAMLWAFDLLEWNGEDLRPLPLDERKSKLAKLLKASRHSGIVLNEYLEADGERAFWHACNLGFEGIISKRRDSRYVSGRGKSWLKVKNECARRAAVPGSSVTYPPPWRRRGRPRRLYLVSLRSIYAVQRYFRTIL
jgi:bifunctional non-homologous end joining protein LigD